MRRLSGEFLARLMHALEGCNAGPGTPDTVRTLLGPLLDADNAFVDLPVETAVPTVTRAARPLPPRALERLNALLPWCTLAANRPGVQGTLWSEGRPPPARVLSPRGAVVPVVGKAGLDGQSVLDVGCFEGLHAIGFAEQGARVWAVDGRIENVVKTLVRVWQAGLEDRVTVQLVDLDAGSLPAQLAARGWQGSFDLVHHAQVLNHLADPVAHLRDCTALCHGRLYLNTHVESHADAEARHRIDLDGRPYAVRRHGEAGAAWEPFGGLARRSNWLTRESLLRLLADLGWEPPEIRLDSDGPNGRRIVLMAARPQPAVQAPPSDTAEAPPAKVLPEKFRKVLVVGLGRSGTSALASLLKACGFFMGDDLDPVLHESIGLRADLKLGRHEAVDATLRAWQAQHRHIAWKDPKLHTAGATWIDTLDDDWLILAVFRDPVAVAQRRALADGIPFGAAFEHTLKSESRLREFVLRSTKRLVPVSYERLMARPAETIGELLAHLDLDGLPTPDVAMIWAYMQERRERYRLEQTLANPAGPVTT